jgi:uncharacterized membrane protein YhhN
MSFRPWLTALALIAGALHIQAEYRGTRTRIYFLKPLTTTLILSIALASTDPQSGIYRGAVAIGLLFSLLGDVFLMLPRDRLLAGMASFAAAHLAYILAFTGDARDILNLYLAIPFIMYALVFYLFFVPDLGYYRLPVLVYSLLISFMAWAAWGRWLRFRDLATLLAAVGAILFISSDTLNAFRRFRGRFRQDQLATLVTYYTAQLLIAWSV